MVRAEELTGLAFFMRLSLEEVKEFAQILYEKAFPARMSIFEKGSTDSKMYIVKSGLVEIVVPEGGKENVVATFSDGEFFGEMSIFDMTARSATARTAGGTSILEVSKEDFDKFVEEKPQVASKILYGMMEEMSRRLRKTTSPDSMFMF